MKYTKVDLARAFAAKVEKLGGSLQAQQLAKNTFNSKLASEKYQGHYKDRIDRINKAGSPEQLLGMTFGRKGGSEARKAGRAKIKLMKGQKGSPEPMDVFFNNREEFYYEKYDDLMRYNELRALGDERTDDEEIEFEEVAKSIKDAWDSR